MDILHFNAWQLKFRLTKRVRQQKHLSVGLRNWYTCCERNTLPEKYKITKLRFSVAVFRLAFCIWYKVYPSRVLGEVFEKRIISVCLIWHSISVIFHLFTRKKWMLCSRLSILFWQIVMVRSWFINFISYCVEWARNMYMSDDFAFIVQVIRCS